MPIVDKAKNVLKSPLTIVAAGLVIVALVVAGLVKLRVLRALIHSPWLPEIVIGVVVVIILLIIFVGLPWYRENSFVRRLESRYGAASGQDPQELQANFTAALRR